MDTRTVMNIASSQQRLRGEHRVSGAVALLIGVAVVAVSVLARAGEPLVPALPGANAAQVDPPVSLVPSPAGSTANAQAMRAELDQVNERLAKLRGALPANTSAASAEAIGGGNTLAGGNVTAAVAPIVAAPETPPAPTNDEVLRLEKRLRAARAQVRADAVADTGLVTINDASALRARVVFPYTEGSIYEVYAAPGRMTAIELQPGEVITTDNGKPRAADTVQWVADTVTTGEGQSKQIVVLVKPIVSGIETNLLIPTNRHLYSILLRAQTQSYMPLVAFNYPFDEARGGAKAAAAAEVQEDERETTAVPPESLNFAYAIKGAKVQWRPLRVFDDGTKTYLQMPPSMKSWEAPALFVLDDGHSPQLVNYRVKGDYYIVDRLFHRAQLRVGEKHFVDIAREESRGS